MTDIWTIKAALEWTEGYLTRKGIDNPRISAEWLLAEACHMRRIELYVNFDKPLSREERDVLRGWVSRRGTGEPLQYITGEVEFRYITIKVRPGVLIPRPETEVLVSVALSLLSDEGMFKIADICTGSGCIACSIASERTESFVYATDISADAIDLARLNVDALGLGERVKVIESDLGAGIAESELGTFDLVVSNPPYIPTSVLQDIPEEVSAFEPRLALDGGEDGNAILCRLLPWVMQALKPGGAFAVELHEDCIQDAQGYAQDLGFASLNITNDLADKPRVLSGRKPE